MTFKTRVIFDTLRSLAYGSIGSSYTAIGAATTKRIRILTVFNQTDKEVLISDDGVNAKISLPAGAGQVLDFTANKVKPDGFFAKEGTIFYVKQGDDGAPGSGKVTIQCVCSDEGS